MTLAQLEEMMKTFFTDDVEVSREAPNKLSLTINGRTLHISEDVAVRMDEGERTLPRRDIQFGDITGGAHVLCGPAFSEVVPVTEGSSQASDIQIGDITGAELTVCGCCRAVLATEPRTNVAIIVNEHDSSTTVVVCGNCKATLAMHFLGNQLEVSQADFDEVSCARRRAREEAPQGDGSLRLS